MARSDIMAGRAFVSLTLKNQMYAGLVAAKAQLTSIGNGMKIVGGTMMASGTAIVGALTAAVTQFQRTGDAIDKMSIRTGIGTAALSELGYAAEATDASLTDFATGVRNMQKTLTDAANGSKSARADLALLGLTVDDLAGMDVEGQFEEIADAIAKITDPAKRASAAMAVFGKNGVQLLPMLAQGRSGIEALRREARELGLSIDPADARAAADLGDAWAKVKASVAGATFSIGGALAPALTRALDSVRSITVATANWIRQNKDLVMWVAKVGVGTVAAGAATYGLGKAITGTIATVDKLKGQFAPVLNIIARLQGIAVGVLKSIAGASTSAIKGVVGIGSAFSRATEATKNFAVGIGTSLVSAFSSVISAGMLTGRALLSGFSTVAVRGMSFARQSISLVASTLSRLPSVASAAASGVGAAFSRMGEYAVAVYPRLARLGQVAADAASIARAAWTLSTRQLGNVLNDVRSHASQVWQSISSRASTNWQIITSRVGVEMQRIKAHYDRLLVFLKPVTDRIQSAWQTMAGSLSGVISRVMPLVREDFNRLVVVARSAGQRVVAAWRTVGPQIAAGIRANMMSAFAGTRGMMGGLGRGLGGVVGGASTATVASIGLISSFGGAAAQSVAKIAMIVPSVLMLGSALVSMVNPATLLVAAIGGGVYAWFRFSESGRAALNQITAVLRPFIDIARDTIRGISDAFTAGDLGLAGRIAMAGLKVGVLQGMADLSAAIGGIWGDTIGMITGQLLAGDINSAWDTTVLGMQAVWAKFAHGIVSAFISAAQQVMKVWRGMVDAIADFLLSQAAQGGVVGGAISKVLGVDVSAEKAKEELQRRALIESKKGNLAGAEQMAAEFDQAGNIKEADKQRKLIEDLRKQIAALEGGMSIPASQGGAGQDWLDRSADKMRGVFSAMGKAAKMTPDEIEDFVNAQLADLEQGTLAGLADKATVATTNLASKTAGGVDVARDAVAKAKDDLNALIADASAKADSRKASEDARREAEGGVTPPDLTGVKKMAAGSFSAAGALALGAGSGGIQERTHNEIKGLRTDFKALKMLNEMQANLARDLLRVLEA